MNKFEHLSIARLKDTLEGMTFEGIAAGKLAEATASAREASQPGRPSRLQQTLEMLPRNIDLLADLDTLLLFYSESMNQWESDRCAEWTELLKEGRNLSPKQEALVVGWVDRYVNGG